MREDRPEGFRLLDSFDLISRACNNGSYKAMRYQERGHDHLHEDAMEELRAIRDMAEEALERHDERE